MRGCMYANVQLKRYAGYFSKFTGKRVNFLKKVFDEYGLYLVFQNFARKPFDRGTWFI